jgi:hypothetical protein
VLPNSKEYFDQLSSYKFFKLVSYLDDVSYSNMAPHTHYEFFFIYLRFKQVVVIIQPLLQVNQE